MNEVELKQQLSKKILELGINPLFTENPALERIINNTMGSLISNIAPNNNDLKKFENKGPIITYEDTYTLNAYGQEINKKVSLKLKKKNENYFTCSVDIIKDIPGTITKKSREVSEVTVRLTEEGYIFLTESYSKVNDLKNMDGLVDGFITCINTAYDSNGIMLKKDSKRYDNLKYKMDIDNIDYNDMLYIQSRAFDLRSEFNTNYDYRECLNRESFDIAEVVIEDKKKAIKRSNYVLLNDSVGLSDMQLPDNFDIDSNETIEPLTDEEIKEKIKNESDYQVRIGLYDYSTGRQDHIYQNGEKKYSLPVETYSK